VILGLWLLFDRKSKITPGCWVTWRGRADESVTQLA
jgi:hypothetical protein